MRKADPVSSHAFLIVPLTWRQQQVATSHQLVTQFEETSTRGTRTSCVVQDVQRTGKFTSTGKYGFDEEFRREKGPSMRCLASKLRDRSRGKCDIAGFNVCRADKWRDRRSLHLTKIGGVGDAPVAYNVISGISNVLYTP